MRVEGLAGVSEGALASHTGTVAGRELRAAIRQAGRDTQTGRRGSADWAFRLCWIGLSSKCCWM